MSIFDLCYWTMVYDTIFSIVYYFLMICFTFWVFIKVRIHFYKEIELKTWDKTVKVFVMIFFIISILLPTPENFGKWLVDNTEAEYEEVE